MTSAAPGETSLPALLATLTTTLHQDTFVFLTLPPGTTLPPTLETKMLFQEAEGVTAIATQSAAADHNLEFAFPCRMITLNVYSSLEAVGFMAAVTRILTERGIGTNPVSGFFHDHLFVPLGKEREALEAISELADDARRTLLGST